nr:CC-NBS-LRR resistance protein [Tanacetum cinerariifolium]
INKKLSQSYERANNLRLQDVKFDPAGNGYRPSTVPYLDEFKIIGRENDELCIVELLTNSREGKNLTIVPIVGMGGIGKTTVAKSKISTSLAGEKVKSLMRVNPIGNLQEKLGSKRYLLVLDDVWDEELAYWDEFRRCMLQVKSDNGSGITVTTRKLNIGMNATIENSYALECLPDDDSWAMFKERALPLPEFERIGRDIVKKCRLPLLVDILGSMLRHYNTDIRKWLSIQESEVWDAEERGRVLSILKLSFDNLPNSMVKQCLLYCSIFEKDEDIGREELVQLWMALGLVQKDKKTNKNMEDVGNDIFQILVNNSLLQNVKKDQFGDIYGCQKHDLVHDLLLSLSSDEISRLVVSDDLQIPAVKHLALQGRVYENSVSDIFKEDEMRNLISLCHLVLDPRLLAPKDVGLLTSLQTLPPFQVGRQKGRLIEELGTLKHLGGTLQICNLEETGSKEEALKANLTGKPNLNTINYHWSRCVVGGRRNDKDVLEGLQPAANVKVSRIQKISGDSFPEWAMKMKIKTERNWTLLAKLVKITLTDCHNCGNIPILEDLPGSSFREYGKRDVLT